jgi:hypothetical protein
MLTDIYEKVYGEVMQVFEKNDVSPHDTLGILEKIKYDLNSQMFRQLLQGDENE